VLKNEWRACQRSSKSRHGQPLCLIISMAGRFHLLTQLIRFQGPCFLLVHSWIFRSKKVLFVFLTVFWNTFQLSMFFEDLYFIRALFAIKVSPALGMFSDVDNFGVFHPHQIDNVSEIIDNIFQLQYLQDIWCVQFCEGCNDFLNE